MLKLCTRYSRFITFARSIISTFRLAFTAWIENLDNNIIAVKEPSSLAVLVYGSCFSHNQSLHHAAWRSKDNTLDLVSLLAGWDLADDAILLAFADACNIGWKRHQKLIIFTIACIIFIAELRFQRTWILEVCDRQWEGFEHLTWIGTFSYQFNDIIFYFLFYFTYLFLHRSY